MDESKKCENIDFEMTIKFETKIPLGAYSINNGIPIAIFIDGTYMFLPCYLTYGGLY